MLRTHTPKAQTAARAVRASTISTERHGAGGLVVEHSHSYNMHSSQRSTYMRTSTQEDDSTSFTIRQTKNNSTKRRQSIERIVKPKILVNTKSARKGVQNVKTDSTHTHKTP